MSDPLLRADVEPAERAEDDLPQSLEEDVLEYGLSAFKVKLCGDRTRDMARLLQTSAVLTSCGVDQPTLTVDGNEQFDDLQQVAGLDLQPCGGTHVAQTREIGRVRVAKIEKKGRQNRRVTVVFDE